MKPLFACLLLIAGSNLSAHGRWIVPSHSVLSGDTPEVVTFDFSISNDIFHPDRGYGGIPAEQLEVVFQSDENTSFKNLKINQRNKWTRLKVTNPDGSVTMNSPIVDFGRKSVASYKMQQNGTYRIEVSHQPVYYVTYYDVNKKRSRKFGRLTQLIDKLPKGVSKLVATRLTNRVKTYVTRNNTSDLNLKPDEEGLDIVFDTHPNEFFIGESTSAQLFLKGKPLTREAIIKITKGDTRYRNQRQTQMIKTDSNGKVKITWEQTGLSLIEVEMENEADHQDYSQDKYALSVSIEISQE